MPRRLCKLAAIGAVATALAGSPRAQAPPLGVPAPPLMLVNASVVDVASGEVRRGQTLVVRDGRIESIGTSAPPAAMAPRRVDLLGR